MILAHKIRIDPTFKQVAYFRKACGTYRFTYNWALAEWKRQYESGEKPSGLALKKQFNDIRHERFPWTYDVHRDCTSQPFSNIQKAFNNFFRRVKRDEEPGFPKFKKKGICKDSFYIANDKFYIKNKMVHLPRIGNVRLRECFRFEGKILSGTVQCTANKWFLAVQVDVGDVKKCRIGNNIVGVDLGIKTFATLSTGERIDSPKALKLYLDRLQRISRCHSRKKKGSNNRRKCTSRLARLHSKISDLREDSLHKISTRLCRENQTVVIEDLAVKNMVKNHKLARSISDQGWGEFRRQLEYKGSIYRTRVIVADRFFPSSKLCSGCGEKKLELALSERRYICNSCGMNLDRDHNAAMNLSKLGWATSEVKPVDRKALAEFHDSVKLSWKKQEPDREHSCSHTG